MPRQIASFLLLAAACGLMAAPAAARAETWSGKVVGVTDGDTIKVLRGRETIKIRLHGVDAPEKSQAYGQRSRQLTAKLVFGKVVRVKVVTIGKYGRTVAEVFVGDTSLNEELVRAGLAWWYRRYARRAKVLAVLEEEARRARRGLWADPHPTPPWTYRHQGEPLRGNVKSRVFHAPGCRHYRCKNCTATFRTAAEAIKAGYRPHRACVKARRAAPKGRPPRPRSPGDEDRACRRDRDCVIAWDPCGYRVRPCGDAWKPAINRAADRRRRARWANKKPACDTPVPCKGEPGRWLGRRAVCVKGQCKPRR